MLKVKNGRAVRDVAAATYRADVRRNLLVIFAIALTTLLISAVMAMGTSYWKTISQR